MGGQDRNQEKFKSFGLNSRKFSSNHYSGVVFKAMELDEISKKVSVDRSERSPKMNSKIHHDLQVRKMRKNTKRDWEGIVIKRGKPGEFGVLEVNMGSPI